MIEFSDLHLHSTYSSLDGFGTPTKVVERAKAIGRKSIALTDHGSVSGYVQFMKACKENDLKPIYGCEFYMVDSLVRMFEEKERSKYHLTVIAHNLKGYLNLLQLVTKSYSQGFYYRPTIDKELLFEHNEGLFVFSGCYSGYIQRFLQNDDRVSALRLADEFKSIFGNRYFLETMHLPLYQSTSEGLQYVSETLAIPMILTCDPHYLTEDEAPIQEILHAIRDRRTFDEKQILYGLYQWPAQELYESVTALFPELPWREMFENTVKVSSECNVEMPVGSVPRWPNPTDLSAEQVLVGLCKKGIQKRGLNQLSQDDRKIYYQRLQRELGLIQSKDYSDYFLIVADIVNWAKKQRILTGPARGSSAGSLVCYLLGITEIDPFKHDLIFERFIDESRYDLPDIDIDFEDSRRDEVKGYMVQKYGTDKVCNVGTFAQFKGRNSLDEIGKVFKIPRQDINTVKKFLISRSGGDMRADLTIQDTFEMSPEAKAVQQKYEAIDYASRLEGNTRHMSTHAAGVIVGDRPLAEIIALYQKKGVALSSIEMKDCSDLGLVKIDILGITELSILSEAVRMIGEDPLEKLYSIPLDDAETLKGFRELDVEGIFQFSGDSTKSVLRQIPDLDDFEELVACVTLSKPGPAHCIEGQTLIYDCDNDEIIPISKAYKRKISHTLSLFPDGSIKPQKIRRFFRKGSWAKGKQRVLKISFSNGRTIVTTPEHWFLLESQGWEKAGALSIGDKVKATKKKIWNAGIKGSVKPNSGNFQKGHQHWFGISSSRITKIEDFGEAVVYDIEMESVPNYLANGFVVHNSGGTTKYIAKARGKDVKGFDWHPVLEKVTKPTNYQIIYQEQVIQIVREIGQMSWTDANQIRGFMAKSKGEQAFEGYWPVFRDGAVKNDLDEEAARSIWEEMKTMGRWAFNKCVTGDSVLLNTDPNQNVGTEITVEKLYQNNGYASPKWINQPNSYRKMNVLGLDSDGKLRPNRIKDISFSGIRLVLEITTENGKKIKATDNHKFLTSSGWQRVDEMTQEDFLAVAGDYGTIQHKSEGPGKGWRKGCKGGAGDFLDNHSKEKAEYAVGRTKQWEQGREVAYEKIIAIKSCGNQSVYDIEMEDSSRPSFVINGIISHNSHAVSYAILAFWSMYMKRHHPLQFYAACLLKEDDESKKYRLLFEMRQRKMDVLPPVVGKSGINWTIEGNGVRSGLVEIKGVGEKVARKLVDSGATTREELLGEKKIAGIGPKKIEGLIFPGEEPDDFFSLSRYDILETIAPARKTLFSILDWEDKYNITVAGRFIEMNYKDMHEELQSRGKRTDNLKNPHITKYAILLLEDESDRCLVYVDRYLFSKIGQQVWDAYNNENFVIIQGEKIAGWRMIRARSLELYGKYGNQIK